MIKIVSCFWNVEKYISDCINSVMSQKLTEFKMFLIDDVSDDNTVNIIKDLIKGDDRFILIENKEKKFKLKNLDDLLMDDERFDDEDIIVELDGDDILFSSGSLSTINDIYIKDKNIWITNGSFVYSNGQFGFSDRVNPNTIRNDVFKFSHLRTWKVHLWRNIDEESFLDTDGAYFKSAADVAYSLPMVEMSGDKHYKFISDILYVYNEENPFNDHKPGSRSGSQFEQVRCNQIIRNKKKYNGL
jgi:glycosyltransferase involved in cell wall biosynthesis